MADKRDAILDILGKAYQIETDGYTFYSMTADRTTKPAVQELFTKLASDERQHQAVLQAAGAQFELAVLSIGMTLETNAINYFSTAAKQATDVEVRGFYQFLANWEQQHYNSLHNIFDIVRSDHMAESGFSPF